MPSRFLLRPRWTCLGKGRIDENVVVLIEGERIADVLRDPSGIDAPVIDLPGHLVLPGLINIHTHAGPGPIARGIAEDLPMATGGAFYTALTKLWKIAYTERFRNELRAIVRWDVYGMLRTGTTTIVNQSSVDLEGFLSAVDELGARTYTCLTLPLSIEHRLGYIKDGVAARDDVSGIDDQDAELKLHETFFARYDGSASGRIRMMLAPASAHTVPPSVLRQVRQMANELHCPISTHLCQAPNELNETQAKYGKTPVGVLLEAGLLGPDLLCAHATYVAEEDIPVLRDSGTFVGHCASRKSKEAVISPFQRFVDAGVPVALGTDSFQCDLVEEMKDAAVLGKIAVRTLDRPSATQVLEAATSVGARYLSRSDLGHIQPGATADLIAVNLTRVHNSPVIEPLRSAVYYSYGSDVDFVTIGGKILVQDGRSTTLDEVTLANQARAACERIWEEAERQGAIPRSPLDKD
ncbi:MAG: hypothetical protein EPO21_21250 [Chloroflexota bacterium]|nr:MAG: hypothetical protein EPO21_21250 [Chloroflexota bacterium]